jgi:APA family basic amino acid/polyamine antiporter
LNPSTSDGGVAANTVAAGGEPRLRRDLGVWAATAIVVGTVIGSGIFLVPTTMIQRVGSPSTVFLVWIFGGLLSLFGALTYAEMAAALPEAGGEYVYLSAAYGPFWGFVYGWTQMWVAKSASIATLATGFFYYLANFWPQLNEVAAAVPGRLGPNGGPLEIRYGQLFGMALILGLAWLNFYGVRIGGGVQVAVTIVKVALILGIVVIGLSSGRGGHYSEAIPATGGLTGFFAALVAALWAYDGWNNVSMVASEIRNPARNLPLALIGGMVLIILVYLLANAAYFYVLRPAEVAGSERVAADVMRHVLGPPGAAAVSVAAMISIFAALNGSILSGARVPYAMARDGLFFRPVAYVHPQFRTPGVSILVLSGWSTLVLLSGRYEQLFTLVIFASWILYGMTTAAVFVLRRKRPDLPRPYKVLGYPLVPILFVGVAAVLLASTFVQSPRESIIGLVLIVAGIPFYFYWKGRNSGRRQSPPADLA